MPRYENELSVFTGKVLGLMPSAANIEEKGRTELRTFLSSSKPEFLATLLVAYFERDYKGTELNIEQLSFLYSSLIRMNTLHLTAMLMKFIDLKVKRIRFITDISTEFSIQSVEAKTVAA